MAKKKVVRKKVAAPTTTKGRVAARQTDLEALRRQASMALHHTCATMREEYGDEHIAVAGEAGCIVIGLPLPCLAVEYLFQNTVFPLGRMMQIVGTEGTCKSALCFEVGRWFREGAGAAYLFENESKYSPDYANSIIGWPTSAMDNSLAYIPCFSMDDWQEKLQKVVNRIQSVETGALLPVLLILDSIMGKLSVESQSNIERQGHAGRAFPIEALSINNFLKKFPQDIEGWPISFVAVNHLKPQKAEQGMHMERHKAGGRSISFQETFELEMKRDANPHIRLVDPDNFETSGLKVVLQLRKNSLGETDRRIKASVKWTHRPVGPNGKFLQVTKWDWPEATINLLNSFEAGHRANRIKEVVNIQGGGQKWWCSDLGVSKGDAVSAHDLGVLLERDDARKAELRKLFGIKERRVFVPGEPYASQVADERKLVEAEVEAWEKQLQQRRKLAHEKPEEQEGE